MSPTDRPDVLSVMSSVGVLSLVMSSLPERPVSEPGCRSRPAGAGGIGRASVVKAQSVGLASPA